MGYLGLSCLLLAVEAEELSLVVDWLSSEDVDISDELGSESVVRKVTGELRFDSVNCSTGAGSGSGVVSLTFGWLMALRCAITSSKVGVVVGSCGGLGRNFLCGAGIGFGVGGLKMVGIYRGDADGLVMEVFWCSGVGGPVMVVFGCSDVGGPEMVTFWCFDVDGPEMVVICCSGADGPGMITFDSERMCWRERQYVFPCDSSEVTSWLWCFC